MFLCMNWNVVTRVPRCITRPSFDDVLRLRQTCLTSADLSLPHPETSPDTPTMATQTEEDTESHSYNPFVAPLPIRPAIIKTRNSSTYTPFLARPLLGALLFPVESSDARDHCANERTFLSWLRLAVYLAVVGVAITISFHLKNQPSALEKKVALPLGTLFWVLSLVCLGAGLSNYIVTVTRYGQRRAIVQTGWKTQMVCMLWLVGERFQAS